MPTDPILDRTPVPKAKRRWVRRTILIVAGALVLLLAVAVGATSCRMSPTTTAAAPPSSRPASSSTLSRLAGSRWQDHSEVLPELSDRFHVFAVDVPGHGASDPLPPEDYTAVHVAELLAGFVERVADGPALLSGHSSGALLVAQIAADHPELVSALLLEDPPFYSSMMPR